MHAYVETLLKRDAISSAISATKLWEKKVSIFDFVFVNYFPLLSFVQWTRTSTFFCLHTFRYFLLLLPLFVSQRFSSTRAFGTYSIHTRALRIVEIVFRRYCRMSSACIHHPSSAVRCVSPVPLFMDCAVCTTVWPETKDHFNLSLRSRQRDVALGYCVTSHHAFLIFKFSNCSERGERALCALHRTHRTFFVLDSCTINNAMYRFYGILSWFSVRAEAQTQ